MTGSSKSEIDWYSKSSNDYFCEYHSCVASERRVAAIDFGAGPVWAAGPLCCAITEMTDVPLHLAPHEPVLGLQSCSRQFSVSTVWARATLADFNALCKDTRLKSTEVNTERHLFVDLSQDLAEIKRQLRKSYRSLVNKQEGVSVVDSAVVSTIINDCRDVHRAVAGRQTRSEMSWRLMAKAVEQDEAIIVTSEKEKKIMGYCHIFHNSTNAYYSSSAILNRQGMHPLLWKAIEQCKEKGLRRLYMDIEISGKSLSEKESNIAVFKRGFGLKAQDVARFSIGGPDQSVTIFHL